MLNTGCYRKMLSRVFNNSEQIQTNPDSILQNKNSECHTF